MPKLPRAQLRLCSILRSPCVSSYSDFDMSEGSMSEGNCSCIALQKHCQITYLRTPNIHIEFFQYLLGTCTLMYRILSAFRTHEDRQPTSKFVAACPCPDGLMQDGTQEGNVAYVISHRGARSRGYKRRETARARVRERERVSACRLSRLPLLSSTSNVVSVATSVHDIQRVSTMSNVCPRRALGRSWTSPFIDTRRCPAVQRGVAMCYRGWRRSALSPVDGLMWPSEKHLEPYRSTAVERHGSC
jgi:hypothetical protein